MFGILRSIVAGQARKRAEASRRRRSRQTVLWGVNSGTDVELEPRVLLTVIPVTNSATSGPGSLYAASLAAVAGDDVELQTNVSVAQTFVFNAGVTLESQPGGPTYSITETAAASSPFIAFSGTSATASVVNNLDLYGDPTSVGIGIVSSPTGQLNLTGDTVDNFSIGMEPGFNTTTSVSNSQFWGCTTADVLNQNVYSSTSTTYGGIVSQGSPPPPDTTVGLESTGSSVTSTGDTFLSDYIGVDQVSGTATLSGDTFTGNLGAAGVGAAIEALGGSLTATNLTVSGSSAGPAVYLGSGETSASFTGGTYSSNSHGVFTQAVVSSSHSLSIISANIHNNSSPYGEINLGGGTDLVKWSLITSNTDQEATVRFTPGSGDNSSSLDVEGDYFYGNSDQGSAGAGQGGALFAYLQAGANQLVVSDSVFAYNNGGAGGGLAIAGTSSAGTANVGNNEIIDNYANNSYGGWGVGGGMYVNTASVYFHNNFVSQNAAAVYAPDIYGNVAWGYYDAIDNTTGSTDYAGGGSWTAAGLYNIVNVALPIGTFGYYGGPIQVWALTPGSEAIGAGDPGGIGTYDITGHLRSPYNDIGVTVVVA